MNPLRTLCVMGTLGSPAAGKIETLRDKLRARGFSPDAYEPHVTFGIYSGLGEADLLEWIAPVAARHKPLPLLFDHFGFFPDPPCCFLAPAASAALIALHEEIHQKFDGFCSDRGCLYPFGLSGWTPHLTLAAAEPARADGMCAVLFENFVPFAAELTRLVITATEPDEQLGAFALNE